MTETTCKPERPFFQGGAAVEKVALREAEVAEMLSLAPRTFRRYRVMFEEYGLVRLKGDGVVRYAASSIGPMVEAWGRATRDRELE